jgi:hypothetical protein
VFVIQLLIYIIHGDRTIIGFVRFVPNLLNRPTDGVTISVRKRLRGKYPGASPHHIKKREKKQADRKVPDRPGVVKGERLPKKKCYYKKTHSIEAGFIYDYGYFYQLKVVAITESKLCS